MREINEASLDLIKSFETKRNIGYLPTKNDVPTAGYGHTGPDVQIGVEYSDDQIDQWLRDDLASAVTEVERDITVPLSDDEFGALVSLTFNIGRGNFSHSTLVKRLNGGDHKAAAAQFLVWDKQAGKVLTGLDRRRKAEEDLFETPDGVA